MAERLLIVYEREQVSDAIAYYRVNSGIKVVAFTVWIESALADAGVPFVSFSEFVPAWTDFSAELDAARSMARDWYRIPEMQYFSHDGIRIGESLELAVVWYLGQALYHLTVFTRMLDVCASSTALVVPYTRRPVPAAGSIFLRYETTIVGDTLRYLAESRGIACDSIGAVHTHGDVAVFPEQPKALNMVIRSYNFLMRRISYGKRLRIFASEYWPNIAPFIERMEDSELVLMDRGQVRKMPWQQILRLRVRLLHPLSERTRTVRSIARSKQREFRQRWPDARNAIRGMDFFRIKGKSWWPLVASAFDFMAEHYAERVVSDIEGIRTILRRERIDRVLLRASVSAQHHFFITAHVAYRLGIPSIEIQHGMGHVEGNAPDSVLTASYLASYGPLMREGQVKNYGLEPERIQSIGSPRFDHYKALSHQSDEERTTLAGSLGLDRARPIVLVAMPPELLSLVKCHFSSHELADFYKTLREVKSLMPSVQFVLKFRQLSFVYKEKMAFVKKMLPSDVAITEFEDLLPLLLLSDAVITPRSTVLCEAMILGKPIILFPWRESDPELPIYRPCGVAIQSADTLAETLKKLIGDTAYRDEITRKGRRFMDENYAFDGRAAERISVLLKEPLRAFPPMSSSGRVPTPYESE